MERPISNAMDYRAALYIRLSKEDENEGPSESVNNQRSMLEAYAKKNCLKVYDVYIDDGWSGTSFERPAFQRMLADIEAHNVNLVMTKDLSRLGRDYIMTGFYMEKYFPENKVRYISLLDGIDTGVDSSANDITPFRAIMNDMYAKDISKKIKSVKRDKQRKGEFIGGKAVYGYKLHPTQKNRIMIDEGAAPVVRRIFDMAAAGMSCRLIAQTLNDERIPPPALYAGLTCSRSGPFSGKWATERIADTLRNETYIGNMVQGRSVKASYKSKKCHKVPKDKWVVVKGTHEPLIDMQTFDAAQRTLSSRQHTRTRTYDFLLKGLIFCRECGYPLAVINRKNAAGEDVLYLICRTYQRFTKLGACTCHTIKEEAVTQAVLDRVRAICCAKIDREKMLVIAQKALDEAPDAAGKKEHIGTIDRQIEQINAQLDQMYMDRISGLLWEADFARLYQRICQERCWLEERRSALETEQNCPAAFCLDAESLVNCFLSTAFAERELLQSLIERVELTREKDVVIHFRFRQPEKGAEAEDEHLQ